MPAAVLQFGIFNIKPLFTRIISTNADRLPAVGHIELGGTVLGSCLCVVLRTAAARFEQLRAGCPACVRLHFLLGANWSVCCAEQVNLFSFVYTRVFLLLSECHE